jgi:hypothetical protein
MRVPFALCLLGLSLLSSGCALLGDGAHLLAYRTCQSLDDCLERYRDRRWAEEAWQNARASSPECQGASADYARGFKAGFAEYLYEGGTGEPPLVAPKHYQALRYQSPIGFLAVQDWFAGYRHGAAEARQRGVRQWLIRPVSFPPVASGPPGDAHLSPPSALAPPAPAAGPRSDQILPPPREVPAKPEDKQPAAPPGKGPRATLLWSVSPYQAAGVPPAYASPTGPQPRAGEHQAEEQQLPAPPANSPRAPLMLPAYSPYNADTLPPAYAHPTGSPDHASLPQRPPAADARQPQDTHGAAPPAEGPQGPVLPAYPPSKINSAPPAAAPPADDEQLPTVTIGRVLSGSDPAPSVTPED